MDLSTILKQYQERKQTCLIKASPETDNIKLVERLYNFTFPESLKNLYSLTSGGFLGVRDDNSWRILGLPEILSANNDLQVDFVKLKIIPLIDCKDNDFLSYRIRDSKFIMFNIVDEMSFDERERLEDYLSVYL